MGLDVIKRNVLSDWTKEYRNTIGKNEIETKSGLISLKELKSFIAYLDYLNLKNKNEVDKIDGIRVYFIRGIFGSDQKQPQNSIAIVPTHQFEKYGRNSKVGAENYYEKENGEKEIICLAPGIIFNENSGLCPPNCAGDDI
jgi:hypothetical protein